MENNKNYEIYHSMYTFKKYPLEFEGYLFPIFEEVVKRVVDRVSSSEGIKKNVDVFICLNYLVEEHIFNMNLLTKEIIEKFLESKEYSDHLILITVDKIFFNEYLEYKSVSIIDRYNPLISSLTFYLNFIINKYEQIPSTNELDIALKLDMLKKGFLMTKSVISLLCDGFETEAFSTWRTIHELECIVKIIDKYPSVSKGYYEHIGYNKIYRSNDLPKEQVDEFYTKIKGKIKEHDLKSKDLKKFLEYGWLYEVPNWEKDYPEMKLNFRKGIELVAGLSAYSQLYESSSEIAHGSSLLIYSNKYYYRNITLICIYETFFRLEDIFSKIIVSFNIDSQAYFQMKDVYLDELNKNLVKLKIATKMKYEKKA